MANYGRTEIENTVKELLGNTVSKSFSALGSPKTSSQYEAIKSVVSDVLLSSASSQYYFMYLCSTKIQELAQAEEQLLFEMLNAIEQSRRPVEPVKDVSSVTQARVAVAELENAINSRTTQLPHLENVPAYIRFRSNIDTFIKGPAQAVKGVDVEGQVAVVPTKQEVKTTLPVLLNQLKAKHTELQTVVAQLVKADEEYRSLNLSKNLSLKVVGNARSKIASVEDTLAAQTPEERSGSLRDVTLSLLGAKALVSKYARISAPSKVYDVQGTGATFGDEKHPSNAAEVEGTSTGPFFITPSKAMLEVRTEGASSSEFISLNPSLLPSLDGSIAEPFNIPSNNCYFVVYPASGGLISMNLGTLVGVGSYSAQDVKDALNPILAPHNLVLTSANANLKSAGTTTEIISQSYSAPDWTLVIRSVGAHFSNAGVVVGDTLLFTTSGSGLVDLEHTSWEVTVVGTGGFTDRLTIKRVMAVPPALAGLPSVPAAPHYMDYQITTLFKLSLGVIDEELAVTNNQGFTIPNTSIFGTNAGANVMGFINPVTLSLRPIQSEELANDIKGKGQTVTAKAVFHSNSPVFYGTSDVTAGNQLSLSRIPRVIGSFSPSGGSTTVVVPSTIDFVSAGCVVGDNVVIRSGVENTSTGVVTAVSANALTISGSYTGQFYFNVCPDLTTLAVRNAIFQVGSGPNTQDYVVLGLGTLPDEMQLQSQLPLYRSGGLPIVSTFTGAFGYKTVKISSKNKTPSSKIWVGGLASTYIDPSWPMSTTTVGTSPWIKPPSLPSGVKEGDVFHLYKTVYNVPSHTASIVSKDVTNGLVQIDPPLNSDEALTFGTDTPVPYAQLSDGNAVDFETVKSHLESWLDPAVHAEQNSRAFNNLNSYISPLVTKGTPSLVEVGSARQAVTAFLQGLTKKGAQFASVDETQTLEYALSLFKEPFFPQGQTLLRTLTTKGATRAANMLSMAKFKEFFDADMDDASYAGNLMKSYRSLAQNDLPINKVNRKSTMENRLISSSQDADFDVSSADMDKASVPDFPSTNDSPDAGPHFFEPADR